MAEHHLERTRRLEIESAYTGGDVVPLFLELGVELISNVFLQAKSNSSARIKVNLIVGLLLFDRIIHLTYFL